MKKKKQSAELPFEQSMMDLQKTTEELLNVLEKNKVSTVEAVFILEDLKRLVFNSRDMRAIQLIKEQQERDKPKEYPRGIA